MSAWDSYAVCACGHFERVPFGDSRHIHRSVCPGCGVDVGYWDIVVGRVVGFWNQRFERKDAVADGYRYVISDERLSEIRDLIEHDEVDGVWLSEGTTNAQCAGAIYDLLSERGDRTPA